MIGARRQRFLGPRVARHAQRLVFCLLVGASFLGGVACQRKGASKVVVNGTTGTVSVVLKTSDYERTSARNVLTSKKLVAVVHGISKQYPSLDTLRMDVYLDRKTHTDAYGNPLDKDKYAGSVAVDPSKYGKYVSPEFICQKAGWLGLFMIVPLPESVRKPSTHRSTAASNVVKESAPAWSVKEEAEAEEVATLLVKAEGRRTAGLLNEAREFLKQVLAVQPDNAKAARMLKEVEADIAMEAGKEKRAAEYRKWMNEGRRLKGEGKLSEAVDAYAMAIKGEPDSRDAQRELSDLRDEIERKRVVAARKKEYDRCMAEALQLREAGKLSQAAQVYDDAAKIVQEDPQRARLRAAECRHDDLARQAAAMTTKGDLSQAVSLYRKALKEKTDAGATKALTRVLARIEAERRAEEERKKAAAEAAKAAAYQDAMKRARALGRDKQWADAVQALAVAFENTPGDPDAMALLVSVPRHTATVSLGEEVSLELIFVEPGKFLMGNPDKGRSDDRPQHRVVITKPFYLGKCEVTCAQYRAVVGAIPKLLGGRMNRGKPQAADRPVKIYQWDDIIKFCQKLSQLTGRKARPPTEAEWEYACRAGTTTRFGFGDSFDDCGQYAWFSKNSSETQSVGQKKPNAWGFLDMHGNIAELCSDWYDPGYYARSPERDPRGPASQWSRRTGHVPRGGAYYSPAHFCTSYWRYYGNPQGRTLGFRVVLSPAEVP